MPAAGWQGLPTLHVGGNAQQVALQVTKCVLCLFGGGGLPVHKFTAVRVSQHSVLNPQYMAQAHWLTVRLHCVSSLLASVGRVTL